MNGVDLSLTEGGQYVYIVQSSLEPAKCKIGITNNLERRLKDYNNITGQSKDNIYKYLFTCEVKNMRQVEKDIKARFPNLREQESREIYFYNTALFGDYVGFIRAHKLFIREIFIKPEEKKVVVKIVKKDKSSLKERGLSTKDIMQMAKKVENDEFYTRYEDIEKEIAMYPISVWNDKVVFCNCDDAVGETRTDKDSSAFALYFIRRFAELNLKKLICTHYGEEADLFNGGAKGYIFTKEGFTEIYDKPRGFTGSFDHRLSLKILKDEADIVCTNPPFSKAISYWRILIGSKKKFLIISNITNVINTAYLPYFKASKVWAGYNDVDWFLNLKREPVRAAGYWFTNIPINNRPKYSRLKIVPLAQIPEKYKKYDDIETLLVDNCYIPNDYKEPFAVSTRPILNGILEKGYKIIQVKRYVPYINERELFARVLIQKI